MRGNVNLYIVLEISEYSELSGGRSGTASKLIAILQKKAPKKK